MTTVKPFGTNTLATFQYEPFSYTIYGTDASYTLTTSNSSGIPPGYITVDNSAVIFAASSNAMAAGTQSFVITASLGSNVVATSSNTVTVGTGRFLDASNNPLSGNNYVFYQNEPITPVSVRAPFAISTPTSSPILPPGLVFTAADTSGALYNISGTPTITVPQSNYLFVGRGTGSNLGKIITSSNVGIVVSNERVLLNLSGSPIVSSMTIGTPITTRAITAQFPPYPSGGTLAYTWSGLPDGIVVKDSTGVVKTSPFAPVDASYTLVLEGTPTLAAAQAFQAAGISNKTVNFVATRTSPLPPISNNVAFTFSFGETVLFTSNVVQPILYKNAPVNQSSNFFTAQTYFASGPGTAISNIFSVTTLPTDLSLTFIPSLSRSNLSGTPIVDVSSTSYTIRAINSNGVFRDTTATFSVVTDTITFTSPVGTDLCYNFIVARPLSNALTGYYPYPIVFQATAASGSPLQFDSSDLATGIDLSFATANSVRLFGTPTTATALRNLKVVATSSVTNVSGSRDVSYAVLGDTITFADVSASLLSFVQNRAIAPIQFTATALSQRPVIAYTSSNLPAGLFLTRAGAVSGTPTGNANGSFTVRADTGFSIGDASFSFTIAPDSIIFPVIPNVYQYSPGNAVSMDIDAIAYSGTTVSNYAFSNFTESYGLSINSTTGLITGVLGDGIPPNPLLPSSCNFYVNVVAGTLNASLAATLVTTNPIVNRAWMFDHNTSAFQASQLYSNDNGDYSVWISDPGVLGQQWITDFQTKNNTVDSNVFLMCDSGLTSNSTILRSTDGLNFTPAFFGNVVSYDRPYTVRNVPNTSTWYLAGTALLASQYQVAFYTSTDDGVSWTRGNNTLSGLQMSSRQSSNVTNYYTWQGIALGYSNGTLVMGGGVDPFFVGGANVMMRSTDGGARWDPVSSGAFTVEVGNIVTGDSIWVATGSDNYSSGLNYFGLFGSNGDVLKYSSDGDTWQPCRDDAESNAVGYEVAYASNTWLATCLETTGGGTSVRTKVICSTNGVNWSNVTLDASLSFTDFSDMHLPEAGSLWFDGSNWNVLVKLDNVGMGDYRCILYSHDLSSSLTSGWTVRVPNVFQFAQQGQQPKGFVQRYVRTGTPTVATFTFNSLPLNGPTITSPTQFSYTFYQYVPITPIQVTSTGTGPVYYFVQDADLPTGIRFDPLTATFSGMSVTLGQKSFNIYAQDICTNGVTVATFNTNTVLPVVVRQQTGAGAWTSLVRQYTVVNAAQNSVNGRALPATEAALGEFTRPEPPDSVSADGNPNCSKC